MLVCYVRERDVVFARVPKPDQKRILETIVSELLGVRARAVCAVVVGVVGVVLLQVYRLGAVCLVVVVAE